MGSISISYQFSPVPFNLKRRMREELKGNQYKIMDIISDEAYLFQDTRLTLTRELSCRYLGRMANIPYPEVLKALHRLQRKDFISIKNPLSKNEGSLITVLPVKKNLTPPVKEILTYENKEKSIEITENISNSGTNTPIKETLTEVVRKTERYQEKINIKKDIKNQISPPMISSLSPSPSPDDDVIAIIDKREEREKAIERIIEVPAAEPIEEKNPLNHSSNCLPPVAVNPISSKQSPINPLSSSIPANSINTVDNSKIEKTIDTKPVPPAPTAPTVQGNPQIKSPPASSRVQVPTAPAPQVKKEDKEFSSIGSVMAETYPDVSHELPERLPVLNYSMSIPNIPGVSTDNVIAGVKILKEKNLNDKDITAVFERIIKAMKAGNVLVFKRGKYFLNACSNEPEKDLPPVKSLGEQEIEKFIEKVNSDFRIGRIKYVLSNEGEKQEIIEMNKHQVIYWKGRQPKYAIFKELPVSMFNERYFVGA